MLSFCQYGLNNKVFTNNHARAAIGSRNRKITETLSFPCYWLLQKIVSERLTGIYYLYRNR